ncbi:MAG: permease-like cell division protein FtsX, partial [Thermoanaerobaculales bacterium]|nr:permease-like cell division protein FtsX [Thermoanaerobaculales bacterium]
MSRAAYLIRQAFTSLRRNALVVLAAILAVFVSLTLAFGALVVNELFQVNTTRWQEGVHVVVFMKDDVSQATQLDLQREIQSWDEVEETAYCDKTCAWLEFKEMFADQPALLEETDASILPASIRIKLTDVDFYRDITFRLVDNSVVRKTVTAGERFDQLS